MSFGAILTVVIDGMHDTERLESRLVKGNRSIEIFDGYEDVVEQEFTSGIPTFQAQSSRMSVLFTRYYTTFPKISAFLVRRGELPVGLGKFLQRGSHLGQGGCHFSDVESVCVDGCSSFSPVFRTPSGPSSEAEQT